MKNSLKFVRLRDNKAEVTTVELGNNTSGYQVKLPKLDSYSTAYFYMNVAISKYRLIVTTQRVFDHTME